MVVAGWTRASSELLAKSENGKEHQPGSSHEMPEPCGRVDGNLAVLHALKEAKSAETADKGEDAEQKMRCMHASDEVEEVAGRGDVVAIERETRLAEPVSYTHLDVYKRQPECCSGPPA